MSIFQRSILSKASLLGDAVALLDRSSGCIVLYSELSDFLSSRLAGFSFDKTRPFATWAAPDFSHATLLLALLAEDCAVAPLSPRLPEAEAVRRAESIGASCFWKTDGLRHLVSTDGPITVSSAGTVLFTSGSSGSPCAVSHDLESHFANARGAAERIPLQPRSAWLLSLPLNHVSGFSILIRCLLAGATVVFPDKNLSFKKQIEDPLVTHVSMVGVQLRRLINEGASFRHLQAVLLGGGPVDRRLVADALAGGVPLHVTYGMTEAASQISTSGRLLSVPTVIHAGQALPGREVQISTEGEIQLRGVMLPRSILSSDGFKHFVDGEGWFGTGDLGFIDTEGNLVISGRRNRLFVSGGENICPEVIENLLASCPQVRRAIVVGAPHEEFGARPIAFVAGTAGGSEMKEFLKSRLEGFYVPDVFLPWPAAVPEEDAKVNFELFRRLAIESRL